MPSIESPAPTVRNGVPVDKMFGARERFGGDPSLAQFRFTARNEWVEGTASRSTIHEWFGAGGEHLHVDEFRYEADHPTLGNGHGPTPQEYVLHALAACVTAGIATGAAARKIELTSITSTVEGDIDVRGVLGIEDEVRRGFSEIRVSFQVEGDADDETLASLVESSRSYSAVYDMLTGTTPVSIEVQTAPTRPQRT
jgi:uncharacterized OsmC-like protein